VVVQTRTAFRFAVMMSDMCGRRLFGACERKASSVEATASGPSVNAIVRMFPKGEAARRPPLSAKPAMKPTAPGFVVTRVKEWDLRHDAVPVAVNGFELLTPQPAARAQTPRRTASFAATSRL
jgi:hypothetical protein